MSEVKPCPSAILSPVSAELVEARFAAQQPRPSTGSGLTDFRIGAFAHNATRLCGLMGVLFHWSPDRFWASTPHEVATLIEALHAMRGGADGGPPAVTTPPDADAMKALMARFPD